MLKTIKDVEIFSAGKWNGDDIPISDLDEMVTAFNETQEHFKPFLKLGHNKEQKLLKNDGLPAAGYVKNVRRVGVKLFGDFFDLPEKIFILIKNKAFSKRSAEVFHDIEILGKTYKRMLKAVALLGAEMPAVTTLDDIINFYGLNSELNIAEYEKTISGEDNTEVTIKIYNQEVNPKEREIMPTENKEFDALKEDHVKVQGQVTDLEADKKNALDENKTLKDQLAKMEQEKKKEATKTFIKELEHEKLCTPSMRPLIEKVLGVTEKEYTIDTVVKTDDKESTTTKKYSSKNEMLKEALKLFSASSTVNLEEGSVTETNADTSKEDLTEGKIQKYIKENEGTTYVNAYREVMRS